MREREGEGTARLVCTLGTLFNRIVVIVVVIVILCILALGILFNRFYSHL